MSARAQFLILLLPFAVVGVSSAETTVRFEPAHPTTADEVNLIVTDYGPCSGHSWVVDRARFPVTVFGRLSAGPSCPGASAVTTRSVALGSFRSGRHRIVGYVLESSDSTDDSFIEDWQVTFDEVLTVEHRGATELSWSFFNGRPKAGTAFDLAISGEWPFTCRPDFSVRRSGDELILELLPRDHVECEPFLERVDRRRLQPPLEAGVFTLSMDLSRFELPLNRSIVVPSPRRFVVRRPNELEIAWRLFPAYSRVTELQPTEREIWGTRHGECAPGAANVEVRDQEVRIDLDQPMHCPFGTPNSFAVPYSLPGLPAGRFKVVVSIGSRFLHEEELLVRPEPPRATLWHDRFMVDIGWQDHQGRTGKAIPGPKPDPSSQSFWFFSRSNAEILLKVLDGCAVNGRYWVFASAATDVAYDLRVLDTFTGVSKTYSNPLGQASPAVTDVNTFACAQ